jgi:RNA polymerase sigma-70 factor (ECF subfamily)
VLYLTYNEGYLATSGEAPTRSDLAADALWLASLLVRLLPDQPEAIGLLALMRLHFARSASRFDRDGRLILLKDQDRRRWDHAEIKDAATMVERASWMRRPGPYQVQAAIAACHAEASSWSETDWQQILMLYDSLLTFWPTPVVRLNRAIALRYVAGPQAALEEVERLAGDLKDYHLYHATRAELLRALDRPEEARTETAIALQHATNPAERELLEQRLN